MNLGSRLRLFSVCILNNIHSYGTNQTLLEAFCVCRLVAYDLTCVMFMLLMSDFSNTLVLLAFINLNIYYQRFLPRAVNCGRFCFGTVSLWFLLVCEISREPLNRFVPNSHGRHVWSLAWTSLKVKVTSDKKWDFSALSAACVWFMFGKTSLASSFNHCCYCIAV